MQLINLSTKTDSCSLAKKEAEEVDVSLGKLHFFLKLKSVGLVVEADKVSVLVAK